MLSLQTEAWNGPVGESDEKKETDQKDARELQKEKTWRKLQRPQTLFYLLGDLCPGRYFVHITTFVWLRTHWSGPLQEVKHGKKKVLKMMMMLLFYHRGRFNPVFHLQATTVPGRELDQWGRVVVFP